MAQSSTTLHEEADRLSPEVIDRHRAVVSLMEELEAVDWYDQRAEGCNDPELAAVLEHNRDEEKEHAVMLLEWLRRSDASLDAELRSRLFRSGSIAAEEASPAQRDGDDGAPAGQPDRSLGIGSLRAMRGEDNP